MAVSIFQAVLGFDADDTELRPPVGETWVVRASREVGTASDLVLTDGTTTTNFQTSSSRDPLAITNAWYLTVAGQAQTTPNGWILTVEYGIGAFSHFKPPA